MQRPTADRGLALSFSLLKEVKENVMTVSYQIENINTEINYFKNGNFEVEKYN